MSQQEEPTMWVRFTQDHEYRPAEQLGMVSIDYKAGWSGSVRRSCGDEAIGLGRAEAIETPGRPSKSKVD